jgi:hypothetical protein
MDVTTLWHLSSWKSEPFTHFSPAAVLRGEGLLGASGGIGGRELIAPSESKAIVGECRYDPLGVEEQFLAKPMH